MKTCKIFLIPVALFVLFFTGFFGEYAKAHTAELIFRNASLTKPISVQVYPISMVFNGNNKYDLHARYFNQNYHYNIGKGTGSYAFHIPPNTVDFAVINHDADGTVGNNQASVGFGKYKVYINWGSGWDTCTIEWDYGYSLNFPNFSGDLTIIFRDDLNNPRVNFKWSGSSLEYPITSSNKEIVAWNQQDYGGSRRRREKVYGNFIYDNSFGNTYNIFPQDSRRDCGNEVQSFEDNRSGVLTLNLTIDKDVFTPTLASFYDFPTYVTINPAVALRINPNRTLDFSEVTPYSPGMEFIMTVKPQASLYLYDNARILIRNHNKLILESGGYISLSQGSEIRVKPGGLFCNQGGTVTGPGRIIYESGNYYQCPATAEFSISGGANISLESNAVLEIPDNTTLIFKDNNSSLSMSENSKLLLGKNSRVVFEKGSRLISNDEEYNFNSTRSFSSSVNENNMIDHKTLSGKLSENISVNSYGSSGKIFSLNQNIPNPFNPTTKINYQIPKDNFVTLKIFDVSGKEVETVVNDFQTSGNYNITFDGSRLSSGIYYYKIVSGDFVSVRKMILIK